MTFVALNCPQCAAPLPRAAYWRTVTCTYCGTTVIRTSETVRREDFRAALDRNGASLSRASNAVTIAGDRYAIHQLIAHGAHSEVYLARRVHTFSGWVTLKLARSSDGKDAEHLKKEAANLSEIASLRSKGSAYFTQRLPQLVSSGIARNANAEDRFGVVFRHPIGYWGSLHDASIESPAICDARHVAWIWRRALEILGWVHDNGWTHGSLSANHLLVHPQNHGILIVGWAGASKGGDSARDLQQLAWTMRQILSGNAATSSDADPDVAAIVPAPIARLVRAASDLAYCKRTDAHALHEKVGRAAVDAFGPPKFVPLILG